MNDSAIVIAEALAVDASLGERLQFALKGLLVVSLSLVALAVFCVTVGALFRRRAASAKRNPQDESVAADAAAEEAVVVIAAAVAAALDSPHRIVHIRGLSPEELEWARGGRMMHHASHNLSRRDP